ncbi:MAG: sugar phosphate isomerase/epimerase [Mesorhizobium sp.]|uniref:sugar phosphate isomerase/epimerase family protein n=1 Tax=unclassified Mesorhizobium TaxID=325217 RepID=UPI000FCAA118|nr:MULTISPECIES: TIM barrel protein [unclassified Mesorhizobium]RUV72944.1 sugar phosphate isomerase/epimerase [Mesorhizobium sp. M5C.F.Cr.IN.023.01.1.1]RWF83834.1 MAG: sugar phosphate isomerase/epimerase [Mesorhizobium sp.]RWF90660.1 MAG: sugar phosphate isomerase/epimerase [Mesorhizobium sp.]RWH45297.1 MAG: sugar phosphate isomerase/epimerase [Mesorhizobium sp.]RWI40650.1 MAG: sugar phosphate isomerase/epimerase [Mesorhizobium sp.]
MKQHPLTSNAHLTVAQSIYRPQIGIALWKVGNLGLAGFETAAAAGLDHVHVDLGGPNRGPDLTDVEVLTAFDTISRRLAIPITALAVNRLNDLGLTAPKGSEEALEVRRSILQAIGVADCLRVPSIIIPGFRQSLVRTSEDVARTVEVLRFALGPAQAAGITLAYESGLDSERTLQLLQAVGQSGICVQFDTGNPAIYGHAAASVWARLAHVASLDVHLKDAFEGYVPLGDGIAELELTFVAFARLPRPTSFTLEGDYSIDSGARIRRDLARLKTLIARSMWSGGSDGTGCENGSGVAKTEGTVFPSVYR